MKTRTCLAALLLTASSVSAQIGPPPPPPQPDGGLRIRMERPPGAETEEGALLRGRVLDSADKKPLALATVYIRDPEDSSLVSYALTDEQGGFLLRAVPAGRKLSFMVYYTGYSPYGRSIRAGADTLDLGAILLAPAANTLGEVTITGERPPIAIRGDTIEFNAGSFKTRPNSALAELLKKLPGVLVDANGKITVGGKSVDRIMVDGKDFFGNDPKIAMQNLPAAIIDKVQVTDTKTREEELSGLPASGDTKTINVTLQKGKDRGVFGRAYAGYGTDKRYDASALLNYFREKRRISLLGAANNINEIGFTVGEAVNMIGGGGGGLRMISINKNSGSFGINGMQFGGGGEGLRRSRSAGLSYSDDLGSHFGVNGSYFYGQTNLENQSKSSRQNILPDSVFYNNSERYSEKTDLSHRLSGTLNFKDSLWRVYYEPYAELTEARGTDRIRSVSTSAGGDKINESSSLYASDQESRRLRNALSAYRKFAKKGQFLNLNLSADNRWLQGDDYNRYLNLFYGGTGTDDSVNQYIDNSATSNAYRASLRYSHPLSANLRLMAEYQLDWQEGLTDKQTFAYSAASGKYSTPDSAYSNRFRSSTLTQAPQLGLDMEADSGRWRMNASADFNVVGLHHYSYTHDIHYDKDRFFISPNFSLSRELPGKAYLRLGYRSTVQQPDISQLLPVADNTNPLYVVVGNPALKPSVYRSAELSYQRFDFKSGNNLSARVEYYATKDDIASVTSYDEELRQRTTYTNVDGNDGLRLSLNLSKTRSTASQHWQLGLGSFANFSDNHAFVNGVPYTSRSTSLFLRPSLTYGYGELFELTPFYLLNYRINRYNIEALDTRRSTQYQAGISGSLYWPGRLTWSSDLTYTHNSDVAPGYRQGYLLWNASLGLDIFRDRRATLQLSVYDLLDQNISVQREVTDTYIEDRQTVILQRYVMLKLIYNLRKAGEKKKAQRQGPFFIF